MPDLLVLDVLMTEIDGRDVCRVLRVDYDLPILMLAARSSADDRVLGLELGADGYLTKPYDPRELVAEPGRAHTRRELAERLGGLDRTATDRGVDMHVVNPRRKLQPDPRSPAYLLTVHGFGYKLADGSAG
ncbi:response regulator transcription factor [Actinoplanes derwentensis]|uniref:response regulator transcription factor n=1 Tax=Actinoplanes derwentensis TaxID=113562 RepID=UPI001A598A6E|nr:response regulator transcription factor [Actinoplanes derwentensis]GID87076.1 DNA-binding response regulator [Actinoplanes derwentensis]